MKIGYLGPGRGTFGYSVAVKFFEDGSPFDVSEEKDIEYLPFPTHGDVLEAVGRHTVHYGVVAIENSTDGIVHSTVRKVDECHSLYGVSVCGEYVEDIRLFCMQKKVGSRIQKIVSHPSPINQASGFIALSKKEGVVVDVLGSTDEAAQAALQDEGVAALCSRECGSLYKLKSVGDDSVEDDPNNQTRFWVVGPSNRKVINKDGCMSCFLITLDRNSSGGLNQVLSIFAEYNINVALAYPIPIIGRNWEYKFLIEVQVDIHHKKMREAWSQLSSCSSALAVNCLGSYSIYDDRFVERS